MLAGVEVRPLGEAEIDRDGAVGRRGRAGQPDSADGDPVGPAIRRPAVAAGQVGAGGDQLLLVVAEAGDDQQRPEVRDRGTVDLAVDRGSRAHRQRLIEAAAEAEPVERHLPEREQQREAALVEDHRVARVAAGQREGELALRIGDALPVALARADDPEQQAPAVAVARARAVEGAGDPVVAVEADLVDRRQQRRERERKAPQVEGADPVAADVQRQLRGVALAGPELDPVRERPGPVAGEVAGEVDAVAGVGAEEPARDDVEVAAVGRELGVEREVRLDALDQRLRVRRGRACGRRGSRRRCGRRAER